MAFRKWVVCLCIALLPLGMTGCYDRRELEQQAFVTLMGIDKGPDGTFQTTFVVAQPQAPGGGGGGSAAETPSWPLVTVTARSLPEAINMANAGIERTLSLTHLTAILFGRDLAQSGLTSTLASLSRYRQVRGTVLLGVSTTTAHDVLAAFKPVLDNSPSRAMESMAMVGRDTGTIPVEYLQDFLRDLQTPHVAGILPLLAVNPSVVEDPEGKQSVDGRVNNTMTVGKIPRTGGGPVDWGGAAIFRSDKMVDQLDGRQVQYLQILRGRVRRTIMDFTDPMNPKQRVSLEVRVERKPHYQISLQRPFHVGAQVGTEATVIAAPSGVDYSSEALRAKLEQATASEMKQNLEQVMKQMLVTDKADVIPVVQNMRGHFSTEDALRAFPWEAGLSQAKISVSAKMKIRRFGVQMNPIHATR